VSKGGESIDPNQQIQVRSHHRANRKDGVWAGKEVELVDPRNTSQDCSEYGQIVKKSLDVRIHTCSCGYTEDRDVNAARNILFKAIGHTPEPKYGQLQLQLL
jgi:putative transposase